MSGGRGPVAPLQAGRQAGRLCRCCCFIRTVAGGFLTARVEGGYCFTTPAWSADRNGRLVVVVIIIIIETVLWRHFPSSSSKAAPVVALRGRYTRGLEAEGVAAEAAAAAHEEELIPAPPAAHPAGPRVHEGAPYRYEGVVQRVPVTPQRFELYTHQSETSKGPPER
eukprot:GHVU01007173.1.p1 GENE.GHVU01007173.1~~GHVU01007173.1.p1  ORF type:complete len:167 (-),score=26.71 GHVU01007173.1:117-617(-)